MATTLQERPDAYFDTLLMLEDLIDYHHRPKKEGEELVKSEQRVASADFDEFDAAFSATEKENDASRARQKRGRWACQALSDDMGALIAATVHPLRASHHPTPHRRLSPLKLTFPAIDKKSAAVVTCVYT